MKILPISLSESIFFERRSRGIGSFDFTASLETSAALPYPMIELSAVSRAGQVM